MELVDLPVPQAKANEAVVKIAAAASMKISKSRFVAGVQCLKRLYWQVHKPDLALGRAHQPGDYGSRTGGGRLAHQLFPRCEG